MADGAIGGRAANPTDARPFDLYVWVPAARATDAASADDDGECGGASASPPAAADGRRGGVTATPRRVRRRLSLAAAAARRRSRRRRRRRQAAAARAAGAARPTPPHRRSQSARDRAAPRRGGAIIILALALGIVARCADCVRCAPVRWEAAAKTSADLSRSRRRRAADRPVVRAANKDGSASTSQNKAGRSATLSAATRLAPVHRPRSLSDPTRRASTAACGARAQVGYC